jgi:hypothetical protein
MKHSTLIRMSIFLFLTTMALFAASCFYGPRVVGTGPYVPPPGGGTVVVNTPPPNGGMKPHVAFTYPASNPYNSPDPHVQLGAHLDYVSFANDIQVTLNGASSGNWHFNPADGTLNADFNLSAGNNTVTISANNPYGNDAQTEYFQFTPPVGYQQITSTGGNGSNGTGYQQYSTGYTVNTNNGYPLAPPQISILSPAANPFASAVNQVTVSATMNNVTSMDQIQVKVNGQSSGSFTFDPSSKTMQFTAGLTPGNNYFYITAANSAGADSKSLMVYYTPQVIVTGNTVMRPVVTLSSSMSNPYLTNSPTATVFATVDNVYDRNQITVMVNGVNVTNFGYSPGNRQVQFNVAANAGNNYVYIRATNDAGTDSKSIDVVYTPASLPAPVISISSPTGNPFITSTVSVIISAYIDHVNSRNEIQVAVNGINYPGFSYFPVTRKIEFNAMLNNGGNSINISANNSAGSDSKTIQIVYSAPQVALPVVTISSPYSNPFLTASGNLTVSAHVLNVNSQNNIQLQLNGMSRTDFMYNSMTHELRFNAPLNAGNNSFNLSASNSAGSDHKSLTAIYTPAPSKPVVMFTYPVTNPFVTASANITVTASVTNVNSQNDIQLRLNGVSHTDFTFNAAAQQIQFSTPLVAGNNYLNLSVSNSSGMDNKNLDVVYNAPQVTPKPTVTILNPLGNPVNSAGTSASVTAMIMNVNSQNDIQVKVNGSAYSNFMYNSVTHDIQFSTALNPGNNYIYIAGSNSAGSDNKSFDIICTPPPAARPMVSITNPGHSPFPISVNAFTLQANLINVDSRNEIQVLFNGNPMTNFNYNPSNHMLDLYSMLHAGKNQFSVIATTGGGSDRKDVEIDYSPAVTGIGVGMTVPKPVVNIINPSVSPFTTNSASFTLNAFVQNVTSANDVRITQDNNPVTGFSFNPGSQALNFSTSLHPGTNTFTITGSNANGTDSKTTVVNHTPPNPTGGGSGGPGGSAPVIVVTSPTQVGFNTVDPNFPVTATVQNVTASYEIKVNVNSMSVPFVFDPNTKMLTIKGNLQVGPDDIHITATNSYGTDSKNISMRLSHAISMPANPAPIVNFTNPFVDPTTTSDQNFVVMGNAFNVNSSSDIHVTNNGTNVPFTFDASSKQFSVRGLHSDGNNFVVTATNAAGTVSKSTHINMLPAIGTPTGTGVGGGIGVRGGPPVVMMPVITFLSPSGNPATVNTYNTPVTVQITGINSVGDVVVKLNNIVFTTGLSYNPVNHILSFSPNFVPSANSIEIKATNLRGSDVKVLKVMSTTKGLNRPIH